MEFESKLKKMVKKISKDNMLIVKMNPTSQKIIDANLIDMRDEK